MMKKLSWASLLIALVALPASADTAEDLEKWFRDGYAALYVEDSWEHADGSTANECGWYVADKIDGKWLLSQYITMSCTE